VLQFLLLSLAFVVYGSLYPFHFESTARGANPLLTVLHGWPPEFNRYILRDVVLNVILYVPVGLAATLVLLRRHSRVLSAGAAVLLAVGVSLSMEILQVYEPRRDPSSLDVLTNGIGGAMGVLMALSAGGIIRDLVKPPARGLRAAAAILLVAWGIQEFYPFFPWIGRTHLAESLNRLWHTGHVPVVETWLGVAEWFAASLALEAMFARMRTAWLAALMVFALTAQLLIADRALSVGEVVASGIALALWRISPAVARARWCAWLLGSAILLRQLQPFYFLSAPQSFSWVPFAATLETYREVSVVIVGRKAFDYGAMVFALRGTGWPYLRGGLAVAAALALTEAIQTYLPGRTPEITDALLALLMMAMLRKAGK
jgi:VanZ family protein